MPGCRRSSGPHAGSRRHAPVLIIGETGTGKELIARAIHDLGPHRRAPICGSIAAALTENLLESELFGHVKGSFTGAVDNGPGGSRRPTPAAVSRRDNGTSPKLQVKLLRVLQRASSSGWATTDTMKVDVRIIAATNRDLLEEIEAAGSARTCITG